MMSFFRKTKGSKLDAWDGAKHQTRSHKLMKSFLFLLLLAGGLIAVAAISIPSVGKAGQEPNVWQEQSGSTSPFLPKGYSPLPSLSDLIKNLKPAVVNIYTTQVIRPRMMGRMSRGRDPLFDFFGFGDPFEQHQGIPRGEFKTRSLGSGFIISPEGYLVTNHHVIDNASEIKVKLANDRTYDAKVVGSDQKTDMALLKMEAKEKLPFVYLGDSDKLEVGDWVVAIGNPFGLGISVSAGIISGKDRQIGQGPYDDFLQTDASINPGNSGGPLFDTAGNVIGINTAIIQGGSSIGFAVPINLAKDILRQLRHTGKVTRGWIGVGIQDLSEELADQFGVENRKGALVSQVYPNSPAEKAGLRTGDIILNINGAPVADGQQLISKVGGLAPGTRVTLEFLREGKQQSVSLGLADRESGEAVALGEEPGSGANDKAQEADLGLKLQPLTPERARKLGADPALKGLAVVDVDESGPTAGFLKPGDVILEVNRQRVTTVEAFRKGISRSGKKSQILLLVQRGRGQMFVVIQP